MLFPIAQTKRIPLPALIRRLLLVRWNFACRILAMSFGSARPGEKTGRVLFLLVAVVLVAGCPAPP